MGYISQGLGKTVQDQHPADGDAHPDDLEGCSMQIFCTRSLPSSLSCPATAIQADWESASSCCRKTKLAGEKLSGGRHLWLKHREGGNWYVPFAEKLYFWEQIEKRHFRPLQKKPEQVNRPWQYSPPQKRTMESNRSLRALLRIKNNS